MSSIIAGYARTPFARFGGVFATVPATELGAIAARGALERAGVAVDAVDAVVAGQVLQAGAGQNPARQTAVGAGIPLEVPAITINAVCLSGAEAIAQADRLIRLGEADVVLAVGQESMSLAPHVVNARAGARFGSLELVDTAEFDALTDAFERRSMGASTEERNPALGIDRESQDVVAAASHERAAAAWAAGVFADEVVPVETRRGRKAQVVAEDDGIRPETTVAKLGELRPAFSPEGSITAGNASQISDGAAAVVLVSEGFAREHGIRGLARVVAHAFVAGPDVSLHAQPANAIEAALGKAGRGVEELSALEINEAFAAVAVRSIRQLGVDAEIVNVHGGAIAIGHPVGASGARIVGHLARVLAERGSGAIGAAALCGGGGQGTALVLEAI